MELSYILAYGKSVVAPSSFVLTSFLLLRMLLARTADNSAVLTIIVTKNTDGKSPPYFFGGAKRILAKPKYPRADNIVKRKKLILADARHTNR